MDQAVIDEEMTPFRDMTIRFLEQEVAPCYEQWEEDHQVPHSLWNTFGEAGM
ncbi:MAG: acyl-CoA dehydrogenase family protein [Halopseudomonas sp.]